MKKIVNLILLVLITLFSTINVYASTNTYDRNTMENYGVNKDVKDIDSKLQLIDAYLENGLRMLKEDDQIELSDNSRLLEASEPQVVRRVA